MLGDLHPRLLRPSFDLGRVPGGYLTELRLGRRALLGGDLLRRQRHLSRYVLGHRPGNLGAGRADLPLRSLELTPEGLAHGGLAAPALIGELGAERSTMAGQLGADAVG
jgi:hypothetical protein